MDTDEPLYVHRNIVAVLSTAEQDKKRKYNVMAVARWVSFTPFVVSTNEMLGREANFLLKTSGPKNQLEME